MRASLRTFPRKLIRGAFVLGWAAWTGESAARIARFLLLGAASLLFLSAAGTVEASFTVTPSYALAILATLVGAPAALRGWLRLPPSLSRGAAAVAAVYALGVLIGSDMGVSSQAARSSHRDLAYVLDLMLGLALVGLAVDVLRDRASLRRLATCLCVGGVAAAGYAVYQWPALHFGLPFADVNNALNSDGFTRGHRFQGVGLFGWERVRGTFKEPLFLASYLAALVPLSIGLAAQTRRTKRMLWLTAASMMIVALAFTTSSLAWAMLGVVLLALAGAWTVHTGRVQLAAISGGLLIIVVLLGPIFFVNPSILSGVTGRSSDALRATSQNRVDAWNAATKTWSAKPAFGYGPGQSAVQLAYRPSVAPGERAPLVLGSAQGLWAASLIDTGLVGLFCWVAFFAAVAVMSARAIARWPSVMLGAAAASAAVAVALGNVAADRLDLRVWIALGLLAAAASGGGESEPAACGQDTESGAEQRPAPSRTIEHAS